VGQIPSSITRLTNLRELNLNSNRFTGPLPSDLFTSLASSLKTFDVSHNELTGSLPNLPNAGFPLLKVRVARFPNTADCSARLRVTVYSYTLRKTDTLFYLS
jgi:hypothetical protein